MKKALFIILASACLPASGATVIHALGGDTTKDSGNAVVTTAWNSTLTGISGSVGGVDFTYDVKLSAIGTGVTLNLQTLLVDKGTGQQFANNEGFSITVSNISTTQVKFDGFTWAGAGNTANGEGFTIGGYDYTRAGSGINSGTSLQTHDSGTASPFPIEPDMSADVVAISGNGVRFFQLEYQFSNVPEPSVALLGGLGVLGLLRRRRGA